MNKQEIKATDQEHVPGAFPHSPGGNRHINDLLPDQSISRHVRGIPSGHGTKVDKQHRITEDPDPQEQADIAATQARLSEKPNNTPKQYLTIICLHDSLERLRNRLVEKVAKLTAALIRRISS